jgi:hypothetical protein
VPFTRDIADYEGLLSNRKIREVLGFKEEHDWRKYVALSEPQIRPCGKNVPLMRISFLFSAQRRLSIPAKLNNNPLTSCGALLCSRSAAGLGV